MPTPAWAASPENLRTAEQSKSDYLRLRAEAALDGVAPFVPADVEHRRPPARPRLRRCFF